MTGILAGTCGYSGTHFLPEDCCFLFGEQGLVFHDEHLVDAVVFNANIDARKQPT